MYRFNLSAPGTVSLHGQHTMRYDKTCVAAGLNLRTRVTFSSLPPKVYLLECIVINFINIDLFTHIPIDKFLLHFYDDNLPELTDIRLGELIKDFVTSLEFYIEPKKFEKREIQLSLETFFYLLVKIYCAEKIKITSTFIVELTTQLPIGEGLGSSASFAVCLAACFWRWSLLQKGILRYEFTDDDLRNIRNYAFCCENIVYGAMSPIDTVVSTYGSVLMFKDNCTENLFLNIPRMNIILVYSNVNQSTEAVQKTILQEKKKSFSFIDSILDSIDALSTTSAQVFNEIQKMSHNLNQTDDREVSQIPLDSCWKQISVILSFYGLYVILLHVLVEGPARNH